MAFSPKEVASASHDASACVVGRPDFQDASHTALLLHQSGAEVAWRTVFCGDSGVGLRVGDGGVFSGSGPLWCARTPLFEEPKRASVFLQGLTRNVALSFGQTIPSRLQGLQRGLLNEC